MPYVVFKFVAHEGIKNAKIWEYKTQADYSLLYCTEFTEKCLPEIKFAKEIPRTMERASYGDYLQTTLGEVKSLSGYKCRGLDNYRDLFISLEVPNGDAQHDTYAFIEYNDIELPEMITFFHRDDTKAAFEEALQEMELCVKEYIEDNRHTREGEEFDRQKPLRIPNIDKIKTANCEIVAHWCLEDNGFKNLQIVRINGDKKLDIAPSTQPVMKRQNSLTDYLCWK